MTLTLTLLLSAQTHALPAPPSFHLSMHSLSWPWPRLNLLFPRWKNILKPCLSRFETYVHTLLAYLVWAALVGDKIHT